MREDGASIYNQLTLLSLRKINADNESRCDLWSIRAGIARQRLVVLLILNAHLQVDETN